jgi:hypothetical protein
VGNGRTFDECPLAGLWHEDEFPLPAALEHLVGATRVGQRQALGHDRVDLALAKQFEQDLEVLAEPVLVVNASLGRGSPRPEIAIRPGTGHSSGPPSACHRSQD